MKRIAMVKDGVVENIAAWDGVSIWEPEGYDLIDVTDLEFLDIGYKFKDGIFLSPEGEQAE